MKLKNEEEAVRHQAWESELEVGCSAGEARWQVAERVGGV